MSSKSLRLLILLFALIISIIFVGLALNTGNESTALELFPEPTAIIDDIPESRAKYVIRSYNDMVAVFYTNQPQAPKYVTEIAVDSLPKADRDMLESGIFANNDTEVTSILEDFM